MFVKDEAKISSRVGGVRRKPRWGAYGAPQTFIGTCGPQCWIQTDVTVCGLFVIRHCL